MHWWLASCYCQRHIGRYIHHPATCLIPQTPMALQTLFHISLLLLVCTAKAINPEAEALLRWKSALVSATSLSSWSMANSMCSWFGVACDAGGHVVAIHLPSVGLHVQISSIPRLRLLDLSKNHLTGMVPSHIGNLTELAYLDISTNHLEGELPTTISYLENLQVLSLSSNKFTGIIANVNTRQLTVVKEAKDVSSLGESSPFCNLTFLKFLDLSNNQLSGDLPGCFWNMKALQSLDLSNNAFSEEVPTSSYYSSSLRSLHLSNNNFTGCFPPAFKNFKSLIVLDVRNNKISGEIPFWIAEMNSLLRILQLRSNMFNGIIPWQLSELSQLQLLDLAENNFIGSIPKGFTNLSSMIRLSKVRPKIEVTIPALDGYSYYIDIIWKGQDHAFHGTRTLVTGIDLSSNSLSGKIPSELAHLRGLQFLNMSRNNLSGGIPRLIGNLKKLESLDLSWNKLSGPIPPSISNLTFLNTLNLSNNILSGEIPTGSQLQTLNDPSIYSNNLGLCGPPLSIACTNNSSIVTPVDGAKEHHQDLWLYYSVIAGVVFGFWVWFGALFFCKILRFAFISCIDALYQQLMQKMKST
uniref:Uncharacterized protein n=1 Tax=Avena sativa TaxID=4498 RepID=A0ACD5YNJ5_AVESA